MTGCQTDNQSSAPTASVAAQTVAPAMLPPVVTSGIIRIKAGSSEPFMDSSSNVWQAELGFNGGDLVARVQ